jgi:hypothetical protein
MKLYTREQMIEAFNYGQKVEGFDWIGDMIDSLEAIELPSDEQIWDEGDKEDNNGKHYAFTRGAKWMRDKIQGGNK